jgi:hypothetical protein
MLLILIKELPEKKAWLKKAKMSVFENKQPKKPINWLF